MSDSSNESREADIDPFALVRKIKGAGPAPVHLWDPPFCGDMDMLIARDGSWIHEGKPIRRAALVKLFASVLKLEEDGEYYLVTPVEKVRIRVEDCPFIVQDMDVTGEGDQQSLVFTTNMGEQVEANADHMLRIDARPGTDEPHPILHIRSGLYGLINRAVFYRLAALAQAVRSDSGEAVLGVWSAGNFFPLQGRSEAGSVL